MKTTKILIVAVFPFLMCTCSKDEPTTTTVSDLLIGSWNYYDENYDSYRRVKSLAENEYGFTFLADGKFIERKNSGWCGTPPISYANFDGTWQLEDSIISISTSFWGGDIEYYWKIDEINAEKFKFTNLMIAE